MVSVRKRGKVYEYRIEIASIDGVRKLLTKSGFKTRQEALHEGAIAYNEYYQCGKKQKQKDMSYADYLDYWIDNYCNFNLKYSTIVTYLNIIKLYLKPRLGMYKLSQLDSQMLQEFINDLYVEKNLSKWYLKGILKTIKGSLKYACYTVNFINDNPAERVHIPRYEVVCGDPAHIFTQEEIERILDRFKDVHYIYYSFLTAYYTGLRVSEVFGLTWDYIDFEKKTLNNELSSLHLRNKKLENQIEGLNETIDYLESIIKAIIEFIYKLFHNFNIPKYEEKEFRKEFHEHIPSKLYKKKNKDDFKL